MGDHNDNGHKEYLSSAAFIKIKITFICKSIQKFHNNQIEMYMKIEVRQ